MTNSVTRRTFLGAAGVAGASAGSFAGAANRRGPNDRNHRRHDRCRLAGAGIARGHQAS